MAVVEEVAEEQGCHRRDTLCHRCRRGRDIQDIRDIQHIQVLQDILDTSIQVVTWRHCQVTLHHHR